MKNLINVGCYSIFIFLTFSCEKPEVNVAPTASLNVTNAIVGGTTAKVGSNASTISNNSFGQLTFLTGSNNIYIFPTGDSLMPYFSGDISFDVGDVYSLFLGGTPSKIDAILFKDYLPVYTDSLFGLRFLNLSPNSKAISVNLTGNSAGSEVSNLQYKEITEFKTFPGLISNNNYSFQIRDAVNGNLLVTYNFTPASNPIPRFANVTLVIRGLASGLPAIGVTRVNHDR